MGDHRFVEVIHFLVVCFVIGFCSVSNKLSCKVTQKIAITTTSSFLGINQRKKKKQMSQATIQQQNAE